jgi:hypothetical protein
MWYLLTQSGFVIPIFFTCFIYIHNAKIFIKHKDEINLTYNHFKYTFKRMFIVDRNKNRAREMNYE